MMQSMRDNMKLVIWITAIVFLVGFGILQLGGVLNPDQGGGASGILATVNGRPIRYDEFMRVYNGLVQQVQQERALQEGEDSYIREQAWQEMVQQRLMDAEIERRGIKVTPEEIKTAIRLTPPEFLTKVPGFQTNGQFDYQKYIAELENPNSQLPWNQVEAYVANLLPSQKLRDQVCSMAKVSEGELRERFQFQSESADIQFVQFAPDSFPVDSSQVGPAEIEEYYRSHPEEFSGPAEAKLNVVLVRRAPGEADFAAARQRMQGILDQVRAQPDSFPRYARTYSEIGSASAGGEAPGDPILELWRPKFREGLKDVQAGQISPIIQEERSLHIFRIDKRYPDEKTGQDKIHYHEIAIRVQPGPEAIRKTREQVETLYKDAKRIGLSAAAAKQGLAAGEGPYFTEGRSGNQLFQRFPEAETWALTSKVGSLSRPIPHENGWFLHEVADRRPAGLKPLDAVRARVTQAAFLARSLERARAAAEEARAAIAAGVSPEEAARRTKGTVHAAQKVTRMGFINPMGRESLIAGHLFRLPVGIWSPPLVGLSHVVLVRVEKRDLPAEDAYRASVAQTRQTLLNQKRQEIYAKWMQDLRKRAQIKDYREDYFEV